jgi:ADP-ribosylation factor GTPase-activating protein 1
MAALSKGWSLFSAAVVGASRAVSDNVIQPGMEKVMDPELHATVKGYASEAQKRAIVAGQVANDWTKNQLGVDVAEQVGGVVGVVKDKIGGGPASDGYGALPTEHGETSALYHDDEDDFFGEFSQSAQTKVAVPPPPAKKDDWDEWKDF